MLAFLPPNGPNEYNFAGELFFLDKLLDKKQDFYEDFKLWDKIKKNMNMINIWLAGFCNLQLF